MKLTPDQIKKSWPEAGLPVTVWIDRSNETLRAAFRVVRRVAAMDPFDERGKCKFCHEQDSHAADCAYLIAQELMDPTPTLVIAPNGIPSEEAFS